MNELKKFVENLYRGKGDDKYKDDEKLPFNVIYNKVDRTIVVSITNRSK